MDPATLPTLSPTIDCDLQCLTCGYNLRTLRRDGLCPECGSPVADSLHTWLAGRDRRWLSLMAWGASLLFPVPLLLVLQIFTDFLHWEWHILALGAAITAGLWLLASRDRQASTTVKATT